MHISFRSGYCFANNFIFVEKNFKSFSCCQIVFVSQKIFFVLFHVKHHLPILTKIDEISLGDTPETLDARARVVGDISINFSLASFERDFIDIKSNPLEFEGSPIFSFFLHFSIPCRYIRVLNLYFGLRNYLFVKVSIFNKRRYSGNFV